MSKNKWRPVGETPDVRTRCWISYVFDGQYHTGLFTLDPNDVFENEFPSNAVAWMPVEKPEPFTGVFE